MSGAEVDKPTVRREEAAGANELLACQEDSLLLVRGMTSAVRAAAHVGIRREPALRSFERWAPRWHTVHVVRSADMCLCCPVSGRYIHIIRNPDTVFCIVRSVDIVLLGEA